MSKKKISCVGVGVIALGLLVLWFSTLNFIPNISYRYRVVLDTPGGPLPFRLEAFKRNNRGKWLAVIQIGEGFQEAGNLERIQVEMAGKWDDFEVRFPHYDSVLKLKADSNSEIFVGSWIKNRGNGDAAVMDALAIRELYVLLFDEADNHIQPAIFSGSWLVNFESSDELAIGRFEVDDQQNAAGTFLTPTGDYRFLVGRVDGNLMRLSTFDGAHAFLFHARMQDDGTIEGDFWSGNWWHETWTAVRDEDAKLPDAFGQTVIADENALDDMVFKNLDGEPTRVLDLFEGTGAKARIIEIFGTWCPNCSDAGRELVSLREQYGDDLAVVGLAFEITEDFERSVTQVKRHHEHIGTGWPILIAGLSDKDKASAALPMLDKVRSYPTLIFLNADNKVQAVYTGFSGPATGDAYTEQRARFEALIDGMIGD